MYIYITTLLAIICIPTLLTGLFLWKLHRRMEKRDTEQKEREQARTDSQEFIVKGLHASITLGEATAKAVQRLDKESNGEMTVALEHARETKHKHRNFLQKQGIKNLQ